MSNTHLGLLKRRSSSLTSPFHDKDVSASKKDKKEQLFAYLIVLDFEATCWKEKNKKGHYNEIIEFPAVLLDLSNGEVLDKFQQYVKPSEHTVLSEFCTQLTGITQDKVDGGVSIRTCLGLFNDWIEKWKNKKEFSFVGDILSSSQKKCLVATWTDWDLNVCLKYECRRKHIPHPSYLKQWIDLKKTYKDFYERSIRGLRDAIEQVDLQFEGREHSGIDDATNTARLAWKMVKDGCCLEITKSLNMTSQTGQENIPKEKLLSNEGYKSIPSNDIMATPKIKLPNNNDIKITPPLCECGRRCKRKKVINPGPNIDRVFYACPVGRDSGCRFFRWENKLIASSAGKEINGKKENDLRFQSIKKRQQLKETCTNLFKCK